ncbi:MAG: hypothetical protein JWR24_1815 [Actinoallomurus sp.]|nr:hypothetical protein [Actinoallomurus sp.]
MRLLTRSSGRTARAVGDGAVAVPDAGREGRLKYHTARFILVPALRELLEVPVPAGRRPGLAWHSAGRGRSSGRRQELVRMTSCWVARVIAT